MYKLLDYACKINVLYLRLTLSTSAVIVSYNPEQMKLLRLFSSLENQVEKIVLVDNGSEPSTIRWLEDGRLAGNVEIIYLKTNLGIAAAQNIGIKHLIDSGVDYIALFDHDSKPSEDMIHVLQLASKNLEKIFKKIAAVGPRYFDERQNNPPPFIKVEGARVIRKACDTQSSNVSVSYVIASGSLISVATLNEVGLMKEELFIDYVDIEWGLRAAQLGYESFGVCNAFMEHDLGDEPIHFLGKSIPLHSPLRHYYLFRNAIYLYKQPYLPMAWKVGDFYRLMLKYGFYTLFAKPRWQHFTMMTKGMWDGLRGRMGKYSGA